ncbi:phosphatidylinositol-specific phospholipase C/glycerophosphodiester phosphodiesterase family protein [Mucilaginibacter sp. RS28]|uniref:Altered inheritance of mitochondria protein 6 n=1 Tax=Mucilaginibacter straminoryzae TaxID=2932774 RepID=A0A9X1X5V2_9SPHI|nr:phosphatidylinositol-specific phospholipase C/glycerophosphodiester phosphodiesterase family protein [Mucilaginibacter straminoryzae]MCJ8211493.1 phosphatidylinositol-specific phospholipase C/glycerophosphodiester phosphodiesterase family protein [Mucilaginibacter straminoryzae]
MQPARNCPKHLKLLASLALILFSLKVYSQNITLQNAFAHNDYWHKRPLFDALENGYSNIEADIYLRNNRLIVAHLLPIFRKNKNLEDLYLKPLYDCITGVSNKAVCPLQPVTLMIDIKSDAESTYLALEQLLKKYKSILSGYENGVYIQRQLTIVITGHKPLQLMMAQKERLAFIDQDLLKVKTDTLAASVYQTASCRYSRLLNWNGIGEITPSERHHLKTFVYAAHRQGKKVRLWASPEDPVVWQELLDCGVDLINTDRIVELKDFLIRKLNLAKHPVNEALTFNPLTQNY